MKTNSMYDRGGSGMTRGGLDRFLGPEARDYSNLPEHIEQPEEEAGDRKLDCENVDRAEPVCQVAKAEEQARGTDSAT